MFCNSAYLTDAKNLPPAADVRLLSELGHPEKLRIVERLAESPAKQKDLLTVVNKKSGGITRWLRELADAGVIAQAPAATSHDPYFLVCEDRTNELLDVVALLAAEVSTARVEAAKAQAEQDAKRLHERERRRGAAE